VSSIDRPFIGALRCSPPPPIAIIAGAGQWPTKVADALIRQNQAVILFPIVGCADCQSVKSYRHHWIKIGQLGRFFRLARRDGCQQIVFLGNAVRPPLNVISPDWAGVRALAYFWRRMQDQPEDVLLVSVLRGLLERNGFSVIDSVELVQSIFPESEWQSDAALPVRPIGAQRKSLQKDETQANKNKVGDSAEGTPPLLAECLITIFAPARQKNAILGDMAEKFDTNLAQGRRRAVALYWSEAIRSVLPQLARRAQWIAAFAVTWEAVKRWFS
jgi:hypothetical protein